MSEFSKKLSSLRKESGLSQYALADKIGLCQKSIDCWEKGKTEPKASSLIALADYFGVTTDYLLGGEDDFGNVNVNSDLDEDEKLIIGIYRKSGNAEKKQISDFATFIADKRY